jgi:putative peptide zinc metalloprotease protein
LPRGLETALAVYGAANLVLIVVNLAPFVRLDGYLALMSATDISNLRAKAIADARAAAARRFLGAPARPYRLRRHRLAVAYGTACALFPVVLVGLALGRVNALLLSFGGAGALAWLGLLAALAAVLGARAVSGIRILARKISGHEIGRVRTVVSTLAIVGAATALLFAVPVRLSEPAAFDLTRPGGPVLLVEPSLAGTVHNGAPVTLRRPGLFRSMGIGAARVLPGARTRVSATIDGPISGLGSTGPQIAFPISVHASATVASGAADVSLGRGSIATWAARRYLSPALRLLGV